MRRSIRAIAAALIVALILPAVVLSAWPVADRHSYISQAFKTGHRADDIAAPAGTRGRPDQERSRRLRGLEEELRRLPGLGRPRRRPVLGLLPPPRRVGLQRPEREAIEDAPRRGRPERLRPGDARPRRGLARASRGGAGRTASTPGSTSTPAPGSRTGTAEDAGGRLYTRSVPADRIAESLAFINWTVLTDARRGRVRRGRRGTLPDRGDQGLPRVHGLQRGGLRGAGLGCRHRPAALSPAADAGSSSGRNRAPGRAGVPGRVRAACTRSTLRRGRRAARSRWRGSPRRRLALVAGAASWGGVRLAGGRSCCSSSSSPSRPSSAACGRR